MADFQEQVATMKILRVGTWNVQSLNINKLIEVAKKYDTDLIALQDTRWPNEGTFCRDNYTFYYGGTKEYQLGTGFLIDNRILQAVVDVQFINDRLSYIVIKSGFYNQVFINVYCPIEKKTADVKNRFYYALHQVFDKFSSSDVKIVLGDFNAKIGKDPFYRHIIGSESLHDFNNDNGLRVINFAASKELIVKSTCFKHKDIHKATMMEGTYGINKQISHVLIERKHHTNIDDVRSYRGADMESNHFLVIAKVKCFFSPPAEN